MNLLMRPIPHSLFSSDELSPSLHTMKMLKYIFTWLVELEELEEDFVELEENAGL